MVMHVRVARPVGDLSRAVAMYKRGLGLVELGSFQEHAGFDGVMLGEHGQSFHLEFTYSRAHPVCPTPTEEDLIVFYVPDSEAWRSRCQAMVDAGFVEVEPFNPYWKDRALTFADPDGYRVVINRAAWGVRSEGAV